MTPGPGPDQILASVGLCYSVDTKVLTFILLIWEKLFLKHNWRETHKLIFKHFEFTWWITPKNSIHNTISLIHITNFHTQNSFIGSWAGIFCSTLQYIVSNLALGVYNRYVKYGRGLKRTFLKAFDFSTHEFNCACSPLFSSHIS